MQSHSFVDVSTSTYNNEDSSETKTYFPRINPMIHFSDEKFMERYHLSKDIVRELDTLYANSDFYTTQLDTRRGGLSADERASYFYFINNYTLQ